MNYDGSMPDESKVVSDKRARSINRRIVLHFFGDGSQRWWEEECRVHILLAVRYHPCSMGS